MAKLDYNSINFKNKDIDKMASKFGNGDPLKPKSVQDSAMMSRGYTPLEDGMYGRPLTKEESSMNKEAASKSNPSKTGKSPDYSKSQAKRRPTPKK